MGEVFHYHNHPRQIRNSTRKTLQGLDYSSSAGAQAFEDLINVVERLGDHLMEITWTKEQRNVSCLQSATKKVTTRYRMVWNKLY